MKKKAHLKIISSLCNLSESRIASSSEDALIKIWKLKDRDEDGENSLKLIGKIEGNFSWVTIIIPIIYDKKNFIVSCIPEKSYIKIWKYELTDNVSFKSEDIQTLSKDNRKPLSILEIKNKNIIVSSWETFSESEHSCLIFYEFHETSYREKNKLEYGYSQNKGIVQLNDNYIAVLNEYSKNQPEICLIDLTDFTLQKRINNLDIKTYGSLTRINDSSFIYSNVGVVCQIVKGINNRDFKIVSLMKNIKSLDGRKGIIVSKGGKYIYGVDITYGIFLINAYY
jgi:WD40 repeat protein